MFIFRLSFMSLLRQSLLMIFSTLLVACGGGGGGCGAAGAVVSSLICSNTKPSNAAPVANAGVNQNVITGTIVTLTALASTDPDNNPLTYKWTLVSKPAAI